MWADRNKTKARGTLLASVRIQPQMGIMKSQNIEIAKVSSAAFDAQPGGQGQGAGQAWLSSAAVDEAKSCARESGREGMGYKEALELYLCVM
jgi:hypothetical protein